MRIVRYDQLHSEVAPFYMWYGRALLGVVKVEQTLFDGGNKVETKPKDSGAQASQTENSSEAPTTNTETENTPQNNSTSSEEKPQQPTKTSEELVDDCQLAWENIELARKLFSQSEKAEDKKELALCYGYCGDIQLESDSYKEAVDDFLNAAKLHEEIEGRSSRNAAGDYVSAAAAAVYNNQADVAYGYYLEALTHLDNALRKLMGIEGPETVLETDEDELVLLEDEDIDEWLKENPNHKDIEEVKELVDFCAELTERLDFLTSQEHQEVNESDVTAMVQQMLKEEMGKLGMGGPGAEEEMPVNDLGVAKPVAKPLEEEEAAEDDDELKDKIVPPVVNDLGVARKKPEAKVSIESVAPTSEKRHLEEPTEEQPKKKQKIE